MRVLFVAALALAVSSIRDAFSAGAAGAEAVCVPASSLVADGPFVGPERVFPVPVRGALRVAQAGDHLAILTGTEGARLEVFDADGSRGGLALDGEAPAGLASDGRLFAVLTSAPDGLVLRLVTPAGAVVATRRLGGGTGIAALAWNEGARQWGVVFEGPAGARPSMAFATFEADGTPVGERTLTSLGAAPSLSSAGGRWGVTWQGAAGLSWFAMLDPSGAWLMPPEPVPGQPVEVAGGGDRFLVAAGSPGADGLVLRWTSPGAATLGVPVTVDPGVALTSFAVAVPRKTGAALVVSRDANGGTWLHAIDRSGGVRVLARPGTVVAEGDAPGLDPADDGTFLVAFDAGTDDVRVRTATTTPACRAADATGGPGGPRAPRAPDPGSVDGDLDGYAAGADCDDADAAVHPGAAELCNTRDDDCDGSIDEERGDRYVATDGVDENRACTAPGAPCATIGRAVRAACAGETVRVAEGDYTEDVVVDRPVSIVSQGVSLRTILRGTGATDTVTILAGGVLWNGITVADTPGHACLRVGDAAHPGVRDVTISNASMLGCGSGIVFDSTDAPGNVAWNRVLSVDVNGAVQGDGGGIGVWFRGGNARTEIKVCRIHDNEGPGIAIDLPAPGRSNRSIVLAGDALFATDPPAAGTPPAVVARAVTDLRLEGNDIAGVRAPGGAVVLEGVSGGRLACNSLRGNTTGLVLQAGTEALEIAQNRFVDHGGPAVAIDASAGGGTVLSENIFAGNATALENRGIATFGAARNWWGAPGGPAPGGGDPVTGPVQTADFITSASAPLLVRRPADSGWDSSASTCFHELQQAIDGAAAGGLLLVGPGVYRGGVLLDRPLEIRGVAGGSTCSPSEIDGAQQDGSHRPAVRILGARGVSLSNLTIRDAGKGSTACGASTGDEVGLALDEVHDSVFRALCLQSNGVSEVRVRGDSDGNLFDGLTIDGMWRAQGGADACGHRSRDGVLLDGWPACEGGPGASADANTLRNSRIENVGRGVTVRLATHTTVSGNTIGAARAAAWDGGAYSAGIVVETADATLLEANTLAAGPGEMTDGIRAGGRPPGACYTAPRDSRDTRIVGNTIAGASGAALRSWRAAGSGGDALHTVATCNVLRQNATAIRAEYAGAEQDALLARFNDIRGNAVGARNLAFEPLDVRSNWWGSGSGPSGSAPGSGDAILGATTFGPWLASPARADDDGDGLTECAGDCDDNTALVGAGPAEICGGGADDDCDGAVDGDDADCALLEIRQLGFADAGHLAWDAFRAGPFAVLRGTVPSGGFGGYDHVCLAAGLPSPDLAIGAVPHPGTAHYFLVAAQSGGPAPRLGPLGRGSAGAWRPVPAERCP